MEIFVFLLLIFGLIFLVGFALQVFFLLALSRALSQCAPHNRTLEPGMVWLNLIPLFNIVWMFITVTKVSETLKNEFRERGMHRRDENYAHGLGIAMCISPWFGLLPFLVLTIVYWVKIAEYARRLEHSPAGYGDDYDDDDDDDRDDRRERRSRRDRDDEDDRRESRPWDRGR